MASALIAFAGNSLLCRLALRTQEIDPGSFTSIRLISGVIVLLALTWSKSSSRIIGGAWISAAALFIYAAGFSWAYVSLSTATGALLLFGSVQGTMITAGWLNGERMKIINLFGCILATLGLVTLLMPGLLAPPMESASLMVAAGIAWGVYSLMGRKLGNPLIATSGNFVRTLPFVALMYLVTSTEFHATERGYIFAIASGALTSAIGYAIWYSVLPQLTATRAAVVQLSVPIIATLGGWLFLGEAITIRVLVSAVLILVGIWLVVRK